jgi:molybdopterin-guanine dinucleotide biosynthesis protein A
VPPAVTHFPISGAILAGGKSSRMGRDKAFLPFPAPDGPPLIARQASLLRELGITDLLISGRPDTDYASTVPDARVILDATADAGPLAGLSAVLGAARHPHVLVLAVDLPLITTDYLRTLIAAAPLPAGVVPLGPLGYEPLAALYPRTLRPLISHALAHHEFSLQQLVHSARQASLLEPFPISAGDLALFANWNSPGDFTR